MSRETASGFTHLPESPTALMSPSVCPKRWNVLRADRPTRASRAPAAKSVLAGSRPRFPPAPAIAWTSPAQRVDTRTHPVHTTSIHSSIKGGNSMLVIERGSPV